MALFLCRLGGPRPTFPHDMTPAESALMGEHAAYWSGLVASGACVAFGPVFDPAGVWGCALVEVDGEDAARAATAADPVIRAGAGFRFDVFSMPGAIARPQA